MRRLRSQLARLFLVGCLLGTAALSAADEPATHALDDKEKEAILKSESREAILTRQQALIGALQDMKIPRAPLERLAEFLEKNPKATPEQFNRILDSVAETMPGVFGTDLKARLKKLYLDELGSIKVNPATEFIAAAKVVAGKLPVVPVPTNPPANPNVPGDPANTVSTLSGATVTPAGRGAESFGDISKLLKGNEDAKGLKALEEKLSALQDQFARQQNLAKGDAGAGGLSGSGERGGILGQLLGLLRKEGDEKEKGKGKGDDRGPRPPPDHSAGKQAAAEPKDDPRPDKKAEPDSKRDRDRDRDRGRRGGGGQQSDNSKSGSDKGDEKKADKDKDKKAEPLFADSPKPEKEKSKAPTEEKTPEAPATDPLADAANILTGKPKPKISLGQGSAGSPIQNQTASASFPAPPDPAQPPNTNAGGSGPVVGGPGGQGGGGNGLGEPPSVGGGEDPGMGAGGPPGGTYNFIRMTEYTSGSGGGDSGGDSSDPAGGYADDTPATPARRGPGPLMGSEPLRIASAGEVNKGWLLDLVGHWKKKICEGPDRGKVAICFNVTGPGKGNQELLFRAGIQ